MSSTIGILMANQRIAQLADPSTSSDASTKSYVDVSLNNAVNSLKSYSDVSLNNAVNSLKSYSDVSLNNAVNSLKSYSDASLNAAIATVHQVGDIKMSILNYNHQGWVICDGSEVDLPKYLALYGVIGTSFGAGNNVNTFNLPNAAGKVLGTVHGTRHPLGSVDGSENHILTIEELPPHSHTYQDAYFAENISNNRTNYGTQAGHDWDNNFIYRTINGGYSTDANDSNTFLYTGFGPGTRTAFSVMQPTLFIGNTFIYTGVFDLD